MSKQVNNSIDTEPFQEESPLEKALRLRDKVKFPTMKEFLKDYYGTLWPFSESIGKAKKWSDLEHYFIISLRQNWHRDTSQWLVMQYIMSRTLNPSKIKPNQLKHLPRCFWIKKQELADFMARLKA